MSILVGFLSIPARILRNSWNSTEFLDSGRIPRIPAGISGGMESIEIWTNNVYRNRHLRTFQGACCI